MKYLSKFDRYIGINEDTDHLTLPFGGSVYLSFFKTFFSIFKSKERFLRIWNESDIRDKMSDLYTFFVDALTIMKLGRKDILSYAENLGITDKQNVESSLLVSMYKENLKRDLLTDINESIQYLDENKKDFAPHSELESLSNNYIEEIEEFIQLLNKK